MRGFRPASRQIGFDQARFPAASITETRSQGEPSERDSVELRFKARDDFGRPYRARWRTMNLSACATPWVPPNRGMACLDESVAFRLYALAGTVSPHMNYLRFRVIDEAEEQIALRRQQPAGRLRVNAAMPFMLHVVAPLVPDAALLPQRLRQLEVGRPMLDQEAPYRGIRGVLHAAQRLDLAGIAKLQQHRPRQDLLARRTIAERVGEPAAHPVEHVASAAIDQVVGEPAQ